MLFKPGKYHYSSRTGKVMPCSAKEKACQYAVHYDMPAQRQFKQTVPEGITKPPIIHAPIEYGEPTTNVKLDSVDPYRAINKMLGSPQHKPLPTELCELIDLNHWGDSNTWIFNPDKSVNPPETLYSAVQKWFWSQPNANDNQGVLEYVRNKGTNTTGLTPIDAIKKQYVEENLILIQQQASSSFLQRVMRTTKVERSKINLNQINAGTVRLTEVEARPPVNFKNQPGIAGILLRTGDNSYKLIDGFHRLKHLKNENQAEATYIVLS